jgi:hypothetical protein
VQDYFNQVEQAVQAGLYYLALGGALMIPDMCAAMEQTNPTTAGARYEAWFDQHVAPRYTFGPDRVPSLTGAGAWALRCSFLHEGSTQNPRGNYERILFVEPPYALHNNEIMGALNLNLGDFCADVVDAARAWFATAQHTPTYLQNFSHFVERYPNGFPPYIQGVPVIT